MMGAGAHILALAIALPGPASAFDMDTHVTDRARLFSEVCMGSAPGFEALSETAIQAGFERVGDRLQFAEVLLSLRPNADGTLCACQMSMFAPDFPLLLVTMVDRLRADYPQWRHDDALGGKGYSAYYTRAGEDVVLELTPQKFNEYDMLVGWVVAQGGCPA